MSKGLPPPTPEVLRHLWYALLSGDPLVTKPGNHGGSPDSDKQRAYRAAHGLDPEFLQQMAKLFRDKQALHRATVSRRSFRCVEGRKPRPIDEPPLAKRTFQLLLLDYLQAHFDLQGHVLPDVVAYRDLTDYPSFARRKDGATIQDVFAHRVFRLIRAHGPWVVSLDLRDAFGNLPFKAILAVLKHLGVPRELRREILEQVRVRTRLPNGKILKPKGYGIEQGGTMSPLIFNLVMSHVLAKVREEGGFVGASYGDDVVIVAPSRAEALRAFDFFEGIAVSLGFRNIRGIGTGEKASRVIDTRTERVTLIRTYSIGGGTIELVEDKVADLRSRVGPNPTFTEVREQNIWKVVSNRFLRDTFGLELKRLEPASQPAGGQGGLPTDLVDLSDGGGAVNPSQDKSGSGTDVLVSGTQHEEGIACTDPLVGLTDRSTYPYAAGSLAEVGDLGNKTNSHVVIVSPGMLSVGPVDGGMGSMLMDSMLVAGTSDSECIIHADRIDPIQSASINDRGNATRGGPGDPVTRAASRGGPRRESRSPTPTVQTLKAEELRDLTLGARLREVRQRRGAILDVTGLAARLGPGKLTHGLAEALRVTCHAGKSMVLVHPGHAWLWEHERVGDRRREQVIDHPAGLVLVYRVRRERPARETRKASMPTDAELVIRRFDRAPDDRRIGVLWLDGVAGPKKVREATVSVSHPIARLEAVASVATRLDPASIAVPASFVPAGLLVPLPGASAKARCRHVGLEEAVASLLRGWRWSLSASGIGRMLIGRRRSGTRKGSSRA